MSLRWYITSFLQKAPRQVQELPNTRCKITLAFPSALILFVFLFGSLPTADAEQYRQDGSKQASLVNQGGVGKIAPLSPMQQYEQDFEDYQTLRNAWVSLMEIREETEEELTKITSEISSDPNSTDDTYGKRIQYEAGLRELDEQIELLWYLMYLRHKAMIPSSRWRW